MFEKWSKMKRCLQSKLTATRCAAGRPACVRCNVPAAAADAESKAEAVTAKAAERGCSRQRQQRQRREREAAAKAAKRAKRAAAESMQGQRAAGSCASQTKTKQKA